MNQRPRIGGRWLAGLAGYVAWRGAGCVLERVIRSAWSVAVLVAGLQWMSVANGANPAVSPGPSAPRRVGIADPAILMAPYVWKCSGSALSARAEATMPGAYLRLRFQGSSAFSLVVDGAANNGCPPAAMPVIEYSWDGGASQVVQLKKTGEVYSLPLANALDAAKPHLLELGFRSACLGPDRWTASTVHLRLAGIEIEGGGSLLACPERPRRAIGFGDSITEGVCSEGLCPFYSNLLMNNARVTWFPVVCAALDCEYGQLGTGGQGMVVPRALPPLAQTWDHFDAATSRLRDGRLMPEPDYVFCCMGTNDFEDRGGRHQHKDITSACIEWLVAARQGCPNARFFCVVPPLGWHATEWAAAVQARRQGGDRKVYLIDTAPLKGGYAPQGATQYAPDGVHPSVYGNAILGAFVAAQAQKLISEGENR